MTQFFKTAVMLANEFQDPSRDTRIDRMLELRDAIHPTCVYYKFLYRLVCVGRPLDIIEIGTYAGVSAAHMSEPNWIWTDDVTHGRVCTNGRVITVDINPDAKRCVDELPEFITNRPKVVIGDSLDALPRVKELLGAGQKADVLYIDGQHTFARAYHEYFAYRKLVRDRGLIIIDDVGLVMDGDEMNVFWDRISEPKQRVDWLHPNVGFGLVEKRDDTELEPPDLAIDRANAEIRRRRKK